MTKLPNLILRLKYKKLDYSKIKLDLNWSIYKAIMNPILSKKILIYLFLNFNYLDWSI
jgi:hypothetical protein